MDALCLSKCDFLLRSASAVSEFAIFFNPTLHDYSLNLQYDCKHFLRGNTNQTKDVFSENWTEIILRMYINQMGHKDKNTTKRRKKSDKRKDKWKYNGKYSNKATRTKINKVQNTISSRRPL